MFHTVRACGKFKYLNYFAMFYSVLGPVPGTGHAKMNKAQSLPSPAYQTLPLGIRVLQEDADAQ